MNVGVMKPIATGARAVGVGTRRRWRSEDAMRLARAAGVDDPWELINPVCFREPLAPWTAAMRARQPIQLGRVFRAYHTLRQRHDFLIVEGIGGWLVPFSARLNVETLAQRLGLPVLLVSRPDLGTLNHTLLSLEAIRRAGVVLAGVVFNHTRPRPRTAMARVAQHTNPTLVARLGRVPVLGELPYRAGGGTGQEGGQGLAEAVARHVPGLMRAVRSQTKQVSRRVRVAAMCG